jgi:hypothetical protein
MEEVLNKWLAWSQLSSQTIQHNQKRGLPVDSSDYFKKQKDFYAWHNSGTFPKACGYCCVK